MSVFTDLLSLHGYLIPPHNDDAEAAPPPTAARVDADRLRELIGCRPPATRRPEPRGPLLGVRGLA